MSREPDRSERRESAGRRLTDRQAAILDLVADGQGNKAIAHRLGISEQAVKEHVSNLLRRLDVANRAGLAQAAASLRLIGADVPPHWLEVLFRRAPIYMALVSRERRFIAVNDMVTRVAVSDALGRPVREVFASLEGSGLFELLEDVFATGATREVHDLPAAWDRDGDGEPEPGFATAIIEPILAEDGSVEAVAVFGIDVTEGVLARSSPR